MADISGDESLSWGTFGERVVFASPEVGLSEVDVSLPTRERVWLPVVRLGSSVAVVLLDDQDRVWLVWRYRFVQGRWGWELPSGQVEENEDFGGAAARLLEDLAGYRADRLERLVSFQPAADVVDGERFVLVVRGAKRVGESVGVGPDERAEWVALDSVRALISDGHVWDAMSVVGLLALLSQAR